MGRIAVKAIAYFEIATTLALVIGLAVVNVFQPGAGMKLDGNPPKRTHARLSHNRTPGDYRTRRSREYIRRMARNDVLANGGVLLPFRRGLFGRRRKGQTGGGFLRLRSLK